MSEEKVMTVPHGQIKKFKSKKHLGDSFESYARICRITERSKFYILSLRTGETPDDVPAVVDKDILNNPTMFGSIKYIGTVCLDPSGKKKEIKITKVLSYSPFPGDELHIHHDTAPSKLRLNLSQRLLHRKYQSILSVYDQVEHYLNKVSRDKDMLKVRCPAITFNDCEGAAGEVFSVKSGKEEFFSKPAFLTVSSQLDLEFVTSKLIRPTYSFAPSFRAEKSDTSWHVAEFSHYEPEIPYLSLVELMDWIEDTIKKVLFKLGKKKFFRSLDIISPEADKSLFDKTKQKPYPRVSYTEAISILETRHIEKKFAKEPKWGDDLTKEQERYLCEEHFLSPTFVHSFPSSIKSFYMKQNMEKDSSRQTCQSCDLLVPGIGEMVGGGVREDNYETLIKIIEEKGLDVKDYTTYLQIRKEGGPPTAGFGMGFDRFIMYICGLQNIRDVCPHPRYYRC